MEVIYFLAALIIVVFFLVRKKQKQSAWKKPKAPFPMESRVILMKNVPFYNALSKEEKELFEYKIQEFLLNCRITGIETTVDLRDKLLVAASAIIPIFNFPNWKYNNLHEVLLYPNRFNEKFETQGPDRSILGMVGSGYMEGKMILSKPALLHGFENESDKKNTAIHEFVHLIDKTDGKVDGIPEVLLEKQYSIPWIDLIHKKINEINGNSSDINPYGGTNNGEFFSVASEYFFEKPKLMAKNHPELYAILEQIFKQNMRARNLGNQKLRISRNSPCPCNSGLKFKKCCGKLHYN